MKRKRATSLGQRALFVVLAISVAGVAGVAWSDRSPGGGLLVSAAVTDTTEPPSTTTTTTVVLPTQPAEPIVIPPNSYHPERIVELGRIEIPKLGLSSPIYHGVTLNNIDHGPAHWPGTAFPGQKGNTVFAGHRVTRTRPFRHIDSLVPGDEVIFTLLSGGRHVYRVAGNEVVSPGETRIADQTDGYTATIYACHPPGSASYRFVVHLEMVNPPV